MLSARAALPSSCSPITSIVGVILSASSFPANLQLSAKNNQKHLGIVKAANLCTEIVQFSSPLETAVCTLASLCLPRYILYDGTYDFDDLHRVAKFLVRSLDRLIDIADYPTPDAAVSSFRTRPIGVGIQGLADVFGYRELSFTSPAARALSIRISETVYHAALEASSELADTFGPYDAWAGSPAQQGVLQVDMWGSETSNHYDFDLLRERIRRTGLRNSVLTAQMPTSSTAHLFGNSEGIEPYTRYVLFTYTHGLCTFLTFTLFSNLVPFRILSGNFNEVSRPLVTALQKRGLWTEDMRIDILGCNG